MSRVLPLLLVLAACHNKDTPPTDTAIPTSEGWCAVRDTIDANCLACHGGPSGLGGLDLATDPYGALVNVPSAAYPARTLVVPGDSAGSFLIAKVENTQTSSEGTMMPPGVPLSADAITSMRAWIDNGATSTCTTPVDTGSHDTDTNDTAAVGQGWCAVDHMLRYECVSCHSGSTPSGQLDLLTDPYGAMVNVPSPEYSGRTLVVPSNAAQSFLLVKLANTQASNEGTMMPPGHPVSSAVLDAVTTWVTDGASPDCTNPIDTGIITQYHPDGWAAREMHGYAADVQEENCLTCHGAQLDGGTVGVGCDSCHTAGWRTDCTFCHGGTDSNTGAPPEDVLGESNTALLTFPAHTMHMTPGRHVAYDCNQCHTKPTEALSAGHFLVADHTPGVAENIFTAGIAPSTVWANSSQSCSNVYCHGNGRTNGSGAIGTTYTSRCDGCHADTGSGSTAWRAMSGQHRKHMDEGLSCSDCHTLTVSNGQNLTGPQHHVDGVKDVALVSGITWNASSRSCAGTCHGEYHTNSGNRW